ncbi:hypothetical protein LIER_30424 [Lithospermum erythrorhizon]|uniref:Uncharacterized protein n=1 Tax=Lithospermum erythrorhizon TaxID=34254 RepID=A0AAV3RTF7_LITER
MARTEEGSREGMEKSGRNLEECHVSLEPMDSMSPESYRTSPICLSNEAVVREKFPSIGIIEKAERRDLWEALFNLQKFSTPWMVMGDLNTLISVDERIAEVFSNIFTNVDCAEDRVSVCDNIFEGSGFDSDREALHLAKAEHLKCLPIEEDYWKQKSGVKWMQDGDKSTSFFHSWVKQRRRKKAIVGTLIDGDWITDKDQVSDSVVDYFHSAFTNTMARLTVADLVN